MGFFSVRVGYVHETVCLSQNSLEKLRDSHKPTVVPTTNVFKSLILVPQPSSPNSYASFLDIAKESLWSCCLARVQSPSTHIPCAVSLSSVRTQWNEWDLCLRPTPPAAHGRAVAKGPTAVPPPPAPSFWHGKTNLPQAGLHPSWGEKGQSQYRGLYADDGLALHTLLGMCIHAKFRQVTDTDFSQKQNFEWQNIMHKEIQLLIWDAQT